MMMTVVPSSFEKRQEETANHHEKSGDELREEPLAEMLAKVMTIAAHHLAKNSKNLRQETIDVVLSNNEKANSSFVASQEEEEVGAVHCGGGGSVAPLEGGGSLSPRSPRRELFDNIPPSQRTHLSLPDLEDFVEYDDDDDVPCIITCSFDQKEDGHDDDVTCSTVYCTEEHDYDEDDDEDDDDDPEVNVRDMLQRQSSAGFINMIQNLDEDIE
jgi:hypothetical protein